MFTKVPRAASTSTPVSLIYHQLRAGGGGEGATFAAKLLQSLWKRSLNAFNTLVKRIKMVIVRITISIFVESVFDNFKNFFQTDEPSTTPHTQRAKPDLTAVPTSSLNLLLWKRFCFAH